MILRMYEHNCKSKNLKDTFSAKFTLSIILYEIVDFMLLRKVSIVDLVKRCG